MNDMDKMLNTISGKLGVNKSRLQSAVNSGSAEQLLSALGPKEAEKLNKLLSDKKATKRLIESEQVQAMIKKLSEGK